MMTQVIKLFMVLITITVGVIGWITGRYRDEDYLIMFLVLVSATMATFLVLNLHEHRLQARKRKERESKSHQVSGVEPEKIKRSEGSFALKEKKSGLSWGGGNIKASEATRGTKRRFLGR